MLHIVHFRRAYHCSVLTNDVRVEFLYRDNEGEMLLKKIILALRNAKKGIQDAE